MQCFVTCSFPALMSSSAPAPCTQTPSAFGKYIRARVHIYGQVAELPRDPSEGLIRFTNGHTYQGDRKDTSAFKTAIVILGLSLLIPRPFLCGLNMKRI